MESCQEAVMEIGEKLKSQTRNPKIPTDVVPYAAAQGAFDDPQKVKLITNRQRAENSTSSIKSISSTDSTNSTKTFTISLTKNISSVLDIATLNEVKNSTKDENQCGDVLENKSPQVSSHIVVDNKTADDQQEIICSTPKHIKKHKDKHRYRFSRNKPRKNKYVIKFNNVRFKYKKTGNSITKRLEKCYEKTKLNPQIAQQFQKQIWCNVFSNVVSRSWVIKKLLAKVNTLADSDLKLHDDVNILTPDVDSQNSSPPSTKKSFISDTSQKTLVQQDSSPSTNEDFNSIKTANSVISVTFVKHKPFKTEIINVALAADLNTMNINSNQSFGSSNEKLMQKENLTSSEAMLLLNATELTSKPSSTEEQSNFFIIDYNGLSPLTLNQSNHYNNTVCSEKDTFAIGPASSDLFKSSVHSDNTLTFNSQTSLRNENVQSCLPINNEFTNDNSGTATLLDKVKNLGFYPMKTLSCGSSVNFGSEMNDVLITDNIVNNLPITSENTDDLRTDKKNLSLLRKSVEVTNINYLQNNLSLPNDMAIKAEIGDVEDTKKMCVDNTKNKFPTDFGEMWERLALMLDLAVKRLEENLTDKILKDIRESIAILKPPEYKVPTAEIQRIETAVTNKYEQPIPKMLHKEIVVMEEHHKQDIDKCVQCDLIHKQVIDHLMLKLCVDAPELSSVEALKILKPSEIMEDFVKIVKPPPAVLENDSTIVEMGKGDTVTVSTATTQLSSSGGFKRIKFMFSYPVAFIRENIIVLTSIPTFFIVLFCIYGIFFIIMQPL